MPETNKSYEDKFLHLIDLTKTLPKIQQEEAWRYISHLVKKTSPMAAMRALRNSVSESSRPAKREPCPALSQSLQEGNKGKARKVYNKLLKIAFDNDFSTPLRKDIFRIVKKYFPSWRVWLSGPLSQKLGRPPKTDSNFLIYSLVDIYARDCGKEMAAYKHVSEILNAIKYLEEQNGRQFKIGCSYRNVRDIYEKVKKRHR